MSKSKMTPGTLINVLHVAYASPFKLQSDYARENAEEVACLASSGLITTRLRDQSGEFGFGRTWRVTDWGVMTLKQEGFIK